MKHKASLLAVITLLIAIVIVIAVGCAYSASSELPSSPVLAASFIVTDWKQDYYEPLERWSTVVAIYYNASNIGDWFIGEYDVCFAINCLDGSAYYHWASRFDLRVGQTISKMTAATIPAKEVISVEVTNWELGYYE